ncbi:MAG: radical SAM protein, partial [Desulfurococcaceae archaeon]
KLHREILKKIGDEGIITWAHLSLAALKYAEENYKLISKLMQEYILNEHRRFLGVEVGIETGSPELMEKIAYAKSLPYKPKEWPNVVEEAFRIMHDNMIIPAATVILGLPGETTEDVIKTIELVERLRPYRSLIIPMFFVPMGALKRGKGFFRDNLRPEHVDALMKMYDHTIHWVNNILDLYFTSPAHIPLRFILRYLVLFVRKKVNRYRGLLEEMIKR